MKMKRSYILFLVLIGLFVSCTDSFEDFNTDKKNPAEVAGNALFANAQKAMVDQVYSTNVNLNIFKMMAQYWTETTYTDEANYLIDERNIPRNIYNAFYREVIKDMTSASELIGKETDPTAAATIQNRQAIIEVIKVYCYQDLVDTFGDIPYSESMDIDNVYPKYDDAATIYSDMLSKVNDALSKLDPNKDSFGSSDLIYGGDVSAWIKFANTLKIKLGIALADVNPSMAKSTIESAVSGAFTSSADDAVFDYLSASPNQNPLYTDLVASGRHDFVIANTIVDVMNNLDDPRRAFYFTTVDGEYIGGPYGEDNAYPNYSHISDAIQAADYPADLLTYDKCCFISLRQPPGVCRCQRLPNSITTKGSLNRSRIGVEQHRWPVIISHRPMWLGQRLRTLRLTVGERKLVLSPGSQVMSVECWVTPPGAGWIIRSLM
jgi:hypothetical protein